MINERYAKKYCKDDISRIENYDKAVADHTHTWEMHHRLEFTLDGEFAHSKEELKRLNIYYHRPYFELIFLTKSEHRRLHNKHRSDETRRNVSVAHKGKHLSDETKCKISEARKGMTFTDEHRRNLSKSQKGKVLSEEHRRKLSESAKRRWSRQ